VTVVNTGPQAITANFHSGDIAYVKKALVHYVENRIPGTRFLFTRRSSRRIGLSRWVCPVGWRTVQKTWLPRRSILIRSSSRRFQTTTQPSTPPKNWVYEAE
jgi:hypothetical protein